MAESRFRTREQPLIVAHRGASASEPENTLEAFEAAIETGADAVELDVRLTADEVPIVMHDASVDRTTDGTGLVHELAAANVAELNAAPGRAAFSHVPLLAEVLELLSGRVGAMIEIKNDPGGAGWVPDAGSHVEAVARTLHSTGFEGPVLIASFDPDLVVRARALGPLFASVPQTGLLVHPMIDPRDGLGVAAGAGHEWLLPGVEAVLAAGESFVAEAHDLGVLLGTWVVDDPEIQVRLAGWGVDAIATNDPSTAARTIERSGDPA